MIYLDCHAVSIKYNMQWTTATSLTFNFHVSFMSLCCVQCKLGDSYFNLRLDVLKSLYLFRLSVFSFEGQISVNGIQTLRLFHEFDLWNNNVSFYDIGVFICHNNFLCFGSIILLGF